MALGVLQKNHCVSTGWATPGSLWRACYSDLPVAVAADGGSTPWSNPAIGNQPPLMAIITWLVRTVVPGGSQLRLQQGMFAWGAAVIAALIALTVVLTASALPRGPWAAAHVALSPVLVTVSLVSFDALGMMFVAAGLWAWYRKQPAWCGVFLACAFLTRPTLGVVLLAAVLVPLASGDGVSRLGEVGRIVLGACAVTALVAGITLIAGGDLFASFDVWRDQGASYGSLWYVLALCGIDFSPDLLTGLSLFGWLAAGVIGWLAASSRPRVPVEAVALVMLVVVMLTSRAVPVQAALWLLPLIALCGVRWRDHLLWAGVEFAYFVLVWIFVARDSNPAKALPDGWFAFITGLRAVAWLFLARAAVNSGERRENSAPVTQRDPGRHDAPEGASAGLAPTVG